MKKDGPIIVIDDDNDDKEIFEEVFKELKYPNEIIFFSDPQTALTYLRQPASHPFLIISDINMCLVDGVQLRSVILSDKVLRKKCAVYILISTAVSEGVIEDLYGKSIQGLFKKPSDFNSYVVTIQRIVDYWQSSLSC